MNPAGIGFWTVVIGILTVVLKPIAEEWAADYRERKQRRRREKKGYNGPVNHRSKS